MRVLIRVEGGVVQQVMISSPSPRDDDFQVYLYDLDNAEAGDLDMPVKYPHDITTPERFDKLIRKCAGCDHPKHYGRQCEYCNCRSLLMLANSESLSYGVKCARCGKYETACKCTGEELDD